MTVVVSVNGAYRKSANALAQWCSPIPGVIVAEPTVIVVVVDKIANTADVDIAVVLGAPVATHEQTADTMLLGWPRMAAKI
jgi:hypothetical protein